MTLVYNGNNRLLPYSRSLQEISQIESFNFCFMPCFCGCSDSKLVSNTTRHRTKLNIVQCDDCGTLRIDPYLTDKSIERYYADFYRDVKHTARTPSQTYDDQAKISSKAYNFISPHLKPGARIVDYGCGAGGRMARFMENGFDVSGHDLDEDFLSFAETKGLKRFELDQKYDLIYISHVVEHINEPVSFLKLMTDANLDKDGLIFISVPLIDLSDGTDRHPYLLAEFHLAHKFYFTGLSLCLLGNIADLSLVAHDGDNFLFSRRPGEEKYPDRNSLKRASDEVLSRSRRHLMLWRIKWVLRYAPNMLMRRLTRS
jgi:SAM-dependent methyltransferase